MNGKQRHCFDPGRKEGRKGNNFVLVKRVCIFEEIDREEEACCCSLSNIKFQWHYLKDVRFKALKGLKMRGFLSGIPPRGIPDSCERSRPKLDIQTCHTTKCKVVFVFFTE
ncbi:unnamed protein product, partial [Vitis vinifera]|uniref:Uncharacterized protein n=1 Tax=Vitis vinifera TaxID=29760 RepID=D7TQH9_VITVI